MPKGHSGIRRGGGSKGQAPVQATVNVPQAKTIAEANQLAVSLGLANHADFNGLDISVANEAIQELAATKALLQISDSDSLEFIGSIANLNSQYRFRLRHGRVNAFCSRFIGNGGRFVSAISFNEKKMSPRNINNMLKEKAENVSARWYPLGTGILLGTVSHEIGHYLDNLYGIRNDAKINTLFRGHKGRYRMEYEYLPNGGYRFTSKMSQALSEYANANIKEFIAEAWSEYRNNPSPRSLAKEVGDRIIEIARRRNP